MYELTICHLYPDLMSLYGDRGNIIALSKRCQWRDIEINVVQISLNDEFKFDEYDIIFLGGGQDFEQTIIQDDLMKGKRQGIIQAIESGKVFLGICGGFQLLGKYYKSLTGSKIECIGALNLWTHESENRLVGNLVFESDFLKNEEHQGYMIGFENHSSKTYLGEGIKPLGKVVKGFGNNSEDNLEGAIYKNTYCSYAHGGLLPKNPDFTDHLITLALNNKYPDFQGLAPLNDNFENLSRSLMIEKLISG